MSNQPMGYVTICAGIAIIIFSASTVVFFGGNWFHWLFNANYMCVKGDCFNGIWGISAKYLTWLGVGTIMFGGYVLLFGKQK